MIVNAETPADDSLVAVKSNELVGHVMFSRLDAPFRALGLGPVAVLPRHERKGVGTRLIEEGLARAKDEGWHAVFVAYPRAFTALG